MIKKRKIAVAIILSIVTFGIYGIYWFIKLTNEVNEITNHKNDTSGGMAFFLSLITFGLYELYWAYKMGQKLDDYTEKGESRALVYLLLSLFGFALIAYCLMQDSLNDLIEEEE